MDELIRYLQGWVSNQDVGWEHRRASSSIAWEWAARSALHRDTHPCLQRPDSKDEPPRKRSHGPVLPWPYNQEFQVLVDALKLTCSRSRAGRSSGHRSRRRAHRVVQRRVNRSQDVAPGAAGRPTSPPAAA